jgi:predicted PurR-regulated permease PerM
MAFIPGQSAGSAGRAASRVREAAGPVAEAEAEAEAISTAREPHGRPGRPWDRRSPFVIGLTGAAGVAVIVAGARLVLFSLDTLVLIGVALFIAIGLDPVVSWLIGHRMPRPAAVAAVIAGLLVIVAGFLAGVIPPLVGQAAQLVDKAPKILGELRDHSSLLAGLDQKFGFEQRLQSILHGGGMAGAGKAVLSTIFDLVVILVLSSYFVADLPRIRAALYRLVPHSRRPRAILLGDEMLAKVGSYVLGNVLISLIAGAAAFTWLFVFDVPYALMLSIMVAVLDLVPVVGSTVAGAAASLTALTVSVPIGLATAGYFVVYRVVEDYLLLPKIIGRVMRVPAMVTVVAVLLGGVLLGVVGALVAIPVAAAVLLVLRETAFRRLDEG